MISARNVAAKVRRVASHRSASLAGRLHIVFASLALGTWFLVDGPIWAGVFWLAFAMYNTPRLARMRGSLFSL